MQQTETRTIVFITGAFISNRCWDAWQDYFDESGYRTLAPPWPGKNADPATLRGRHPDAVLAAVTFSEVVAYYTAIVSQLPGKPFLIGHSLGGLIVQILLNKGLAAAAVAIHSLPPAGIIPYEWRFLKSNIASLGLFSDVGATYLMPFRKWQDVFMNGMDLSRQKDGYYSLAIPESRRVVRGVSGRQAAVDFRKEHAPLLLLAGNSDHCIPASIVKRNFRRYRHSVSVTELVVKDRNHFVLGASTWREDAGDILRWLQKYGEG